MYELIMRHKPRTAAAATLFATHKTNIQIRPQPKPPLTDFGLQL